MKFLDNGPLSGVKKTSEGYLIADAYTARTGIQTYAGREVGKNDMSTVRVYRPEDEVFSRDSLQSFSHVPITLLHPSEAVTADNWSKLAKGETSDEVLRDGQRLRIPLIVKDSAAVKAVEDGMRELSVGYTCDLVFTPGITPSGEAYDAVQTNIRANHIAIVPRGRAGHEFRIGDGAVDQWGAAPINLETNDMNVRTITVDGISIQTTDQGAQVIEKLQQVNAKLTADAATSAEAHRRAVEAKDSEIGELKVQLKKAQDAAPTPEAMDKMVADRVSLIADARKIAPTVKTDGLTDAAIRKAAVVAVFGEDSVTDANDAVILGMFRAATRDAKDPVRNSIIKTDSKPLGNGQEAYEARIRDAWKTA